MAKYKVVTQKPAGVTFDLADGQYLLERESLDSIETNIFSQKLRKKLSISTSYQKKILGRLMFKLHY